MTEFFDTVSEPIRYEGPDSDNPLAFRAHHGGHASSSSVWVTYHAVASSTHAWTVIRLHARHSTK